MSDQGRRKQFKDKDQWLFKILYSLMPVSKNKFLSQGILGLRVVIVMVSNLLLTKVLFSHLDVDQFQSYVILISSSGILAILVQNSTLTSYRIYTSGDGLDEQNSRIFESQKRLLYFLLFLTSLILLYFGTINPSILRLVPLFLFPVLIQFILAPEMTRVLVSENLKRYFFYLTAEPLLRFVFIWIISITSIGINLDIISIVYLFVAVIVIMSYILSGKITYVKKSPYQKEITQLLDSDYSFTRWIFLGLLASIANTHILTFWFERNFNSTIVSYRGVATQVFTALISLGTSSFVILKKDIMLLQSLKGMSEEFESVLLRSTRIHTAMMLIPSAIILLNTDHILGLWLGTTNYYLIAMIKWTVISAFVFNMHQPITAIFHGSSYTKTYTIFTDVFLLLSLVLYVLSDFYVIGVLGIYKLQTIIILSAHLIRIGVGYSKELVSRRYCIENFAVMTAVLAVLVVLV